jgi:hypothetical protein
MCEIRGAATLAPFRGHRRRLTMSTASLDTTPDLTVVGTGMSFRAHMTLEALEAIERAEQLFFVAADVMTEKWLRELNPSAERLPGYLEGRPRRETYDLWVDLVLGSVRAGRRTCAASYGHPGVLVAFTREAIRLARAEGYSAVMLPGISTEACLFADLDVDPGPDGWQSYIAAVFLRRKPRFDSATPLVLWQIKVVGTPGPPDEIDRAGLERLTAYLLEHYPPDHEVTVYEASRNPALAPEIGRLPLDRLPGIRFRHTVTLYVPALRA